MDAFIDQHKRSARQLLRNLGTQHANLLRICSFSATPYSIVMWSHYGQNHRGFCIEYDTEAIAVSDPYKALFPVIYSEKCIDGTDFIRRAFLNPRKVNLDYVTLSALLKSPEWKYEQEWRLVVSTLPDDENSFFEVPTPKRVFLGSLMDPSEREEITEICERKGRWGIRNVPCLRCVSAGI